MYALILAGGKGERLRPYTAKRPKVMVELNGKPMMAYQLEWLRSNGVLQALVLSGYRHEIIEEYFGDGKRVGMDIQYVVEQAPLGRGGALRQGLAHLPPGDEPVVAMNGDVLTTQAIGPMLKLMEGNPDAMATIMLTPLVSPYGIVEMDDQGVVRGFQEKPRLPHWINAGVYILSRGIEPLMPAKGDHEEHTFPRLAQEGRLLGYRSQAFWKTIDTVKDLAELEKMTVSGEFARAWPGPLSGAP